MKFAHIGDCHLGSWRQPELKELNFKSFQTAISRCIKERVDFVLITGDLFDAAYPPIDTLKETFKEFKNLKDEKIDVFLIAGSHDYSVSGKSFIDVLEKAGFCRNISNFEERNGKIMLLPTIYKNIALYGYPGKKLGLEAGELEDFSIQDAPGMFKILLLHTAIKDAIGNLPIKSVDEKKLPQVDYLALGHLHIKYQKGAMVYPGPIFPNNLAELEELGNGSFYIYDNNKIRREEIKLKKVLVIEKEINNALIATDILAEEIKRAYLEGGILILKVSGILEKGKTTDIDFNFLENFAKQRGAYCFLKSTSKLFMSETDIKLDHLDTPHLEEKIIETFEKSNPDKLNALIRPLIRALQIEKMDDEKGALFEERLMTDVKKIISS
jgi:DNA repair exonuclease SbcCD nuclease subunit